MFLVSYVFKLDLKLCGCVFIFCWVMNCDSVILEMILCDLFGNRNLFWVNGLVCLMIFSVFLESGMCKFCVLFLCFLSFLVGIV